MIATATATGQARTQGHGVCGEPREMTTTRGNQIDERLTADSDSNPRAIIVTIAVVCVG